MWIIFSGETASSSGGKELHAQTDEQQNKYINELKDAKYFYLFHIDECLASQN